MSYYTASFIATAQSAYTTLQFCDRVGRRHYRRSLRAGRTVYNTLSSDEAIAVYRWVWGWLQVAYMGVVLLATIASEKIDVYVTSCEAEGISAEDYAMLDALADEAAGIEPEPQPEPVAIEVDPIKETVSFIEQKAAEHIKPQSVEVDWELWPSGQLRKLATKHGIVGGARMSKAQAIEALKREVLAIV